MTATRRVALITPAGGYVGPDLARVLAADGHDLVLGWSTPALVAELEVLGATVIAVDGLGAEHEAATYSKLVQAALDHFGRIDAASMFSGSIIRGSFLRRATSEHLDSLAKGLLNAPFEFLKAVSEPMVEQGSGQILIFTSSSGAKVTPGAPMYSGLRAGANHMIRNIAAELAPYGVQLNIAGTNYMDFPQYWDAMGGEDPGTRSKLEAQVPMGRMGRLDELASLAKVFLDGSSGFMAGQVVNFDGGWSAF